MIDINIQLDVDAVKAWVVDDVQKKQIPKATSSALNKVALAVHNRAVRLIAEDIGFTAVYGKRKGDQKVKQYMVKRRATWKNLFASIRPNSLARVPVAALKPKQVATGVVYTGLKGKKKHIPGAFYHKHKNAVYKRKGPNQYPIRTLKTVSIPEVFIKKAIEKAMLEIATERWGVIFPREVNYYLNK